jgi:uncharacterized protein (DUF2267 family)
MRVLEDAVTRVEFWSARDRRGRRERPFHALRDYLPVDEAVYLAAQLPVLLRGICYEAWHRELAVEDRREFLVRIHGGLHRDPAPGAELRARALFAGLSFSPVECP